MNGKPFYRITSLNYNISKFTFEKLQSYKGTAEQERPSKQRDAWILWILCCCACALKKRVKEAETLCSQLSLSFSCSFALSCLPRLLCKEAQGWWRSLTLFIGTDLELIPPRWALLLSLFIY